MATDSNQMFQDANADFDQQEGIDSVESESGARNSLPYGFAKKHSVLLDVSGSPEHSDSATLHYVGNLKIAIVAEVKRRFAYQLSLNQVSSSDFEERLRAFYDRSSNQANQLMDDMGEDMEDDGEGKDDGSDSDSEGKGEGDDDDKEDFDETSG